MGKFSVRDAIEKDAAAIANIFRAAYGDNYCYQGFLDPESIKRLIFSEDTIMIVAENESSKEVIGTASVLLEKGAYTDLVGEFGRLVVHPEYRKQGIGRLLMQGRLDRVKNRLHVGLIDARAIHPYSQRIAIKNGFFPVGYLPSKMKVESRENIALMIGFFGQALCLRRNHPRMIPEVAEMAGIALHNCGLDNDAIIESGAASYPHNDNFVPEELSTEGYAGLLRIERGRTKNREVFGPMRLHYGFFKLASGNASYLIAQRNKQLIGAIGFTVDVYDEAVRVFELISLNDECIRYLFKQLMNKCESESLKYIEVDVSAYAPRMQRTLIELGFIPVAYAPAMVFHQVERLDIVRMAKCFCDFDTSRDKPIEETQAIFDLVANSISAKDIKPQMREAIERISLFDGLNSEQRERIASLCRVRSYRPQERIFKEAEANQELLIVLEGEVHISKDNPNEPIGVVKSGESLAEISAMSGIPHSATATANTEVKLGSITIAEFEKLVRSRPDVGVVAYKNLAVGLGKKLQRER